MHACVREHVRINKQNERIKHKCIYIESYIHTHTYNLHACMHAYAHVCTYKHAMQIYVHTCVYTYINEYAYYFFLSADPAGAAPRS